MKKKLICANCGCEIHNYGYMCYDNYLQVNYFENNKLNRFCSLSCACNYLSIEDTEIEDFPLDDDEEENDINNEEDVDEI